MDTDTESEREDDGGVFKKGKNFGAKTSVVTITCTVRFETNGAAGISL